MAMKKAAPKKSGASDKAKKAQSERLKKQARSSTRNAQPSRGNIAAGDRLSEYEYRNKGAVYSGKDTEGGGFYSTGLMNKSKREYAAYQAKKLKDASQQMKQGVTKSGGYAKDYSPQRDKLRGVKSSKFKAEQAVKKTGSMTRNARNKKRNAK